MHSLTKSPMPIASGFLNRDLDRLIAGKEALDSAYSQWATQT